MIASTLKKMTTALMIGAVGFSAFTFAPSAQADPIKREEIETIIRSYLLENPEIMLEVQDALTAKQEELRVAKQAETLSQMNDAIYNSKFNMTIGDPNAKITLVEFFDYNCGFCRRALSDMDRIVSENPDVKFIMKEFPVLGEQSMEAAQVGLAVIQKYPELYDKFHRELLSAPGGKNGSVANLIAVRLGADQAVLESVIGSDENAGAIEEVYALADGLGITGTPSYVIGDEVVFGAVGYDRIMPKINNLRKCNKTVC